ncbi:MAG: hypothetical protein ACNA7J_14670, partial [Wenzhouxiangella sp.]
MPKVTTFIRVVVVGEREGYTEGMNIEWKQAGRELLASPLAWASYFAWAAVWLTAMTVVDRSGSGLLTLADVLLFAFLLCWMACLLDELIPRRVFDAFLAALTLLTALALWFIPGGATPILLILLALQFANRLSDSGLALALIVINLYFGGVMLGPWGSSLRGAGLQMLGFVGFQLFAVLVMRYADKAEQMAGDLQTVNARLLATRSLLAETARDQERLRLSRELHDVAG